MNIWKTLAISCTAALVLFASFAILQSNESSGTVTHVSDEAGLKQAVTYAGDGDTIIVTADIVLTQRIFIYEKGITLMGQGNSITLIRGANFTPANDIARGDFNPSLIEVAADTATGKASLTLKNITLDDANDPDRASHTEQIPVDGGFPQQNWASRIYDSVISSYSPGVTVTLEDGAKIINIGGASAIRMTGGILNLQPGSYVEGSNSSYKQAGGNFGAMWIQGDGTVLNYSTVTDGKNITAPYFYMDMYNVTINFSGKINNCTVSQPLFKTRGNTGFTLNASAGSEICGNTFGSLTDCISLDGGSNNNIELRGKISNNTGGQKIISVTSSAKSNLTVYGELSDNVLSAQVMCFYGSEGCTATLNPGSKISGNTVHIAAIYLNYATDIQFHVYGEISKNISVDNNGGAIYAVYNNPVIYVHAGAKITGNTSNGSGGGIYLNYTAKLIMDGGTISENIALCKDDANTGLAGGGGVAIARTSTFIMNGGTVTGNTAGSSGNAGIGGGVFVSGKNTNVSTGARFIMNGGTVSGNIVYGGIKHGTDIAVGGSNTAVQSSPDKGQYIQIGKNAVIGTGSIGAASYNGTYSGPAVYILDRNYTVSLGTVLAVNQNSIAARVTALSQYSGYSLQANSGIWYSVAKSTGTSEFTVVYPGVDFNRYDWIAAIQPMRSDGSLLGDAYLSAAVPPRVGEGLKITVPLAADAGGESVGGYGIILLSKEKNTALTFEVIGSGDGVFCIGSPDSREYQAILNVGETVSNFVVSPSSGWRIGSVTLTTGDGAVFDKTDSALKGILSVSYSELASGINIMLAVFEPIYVGYTITADSDADSDISPRGSISVSAGDDITFVFSAKPGYLISA
ncbi:MAG: hypothetical protein LBJ20_07650, partial [Candidatus Methanoplasma sp.]|nr:hypothetical protein [Candidatus Methanoplasma sp.]